MTIIQSIGVKCEFCEKEELAKEGELTGWFSISSSNSLYIGKLGNSTLNEASFSPGGYLNAYCCKEHLLLDIERHLNNLLNEVVKKHDH